jgi:hypothetical protein
LRPQTWDSPVVAGRDATAAGGAQKFPQVFGVSSNLIAVGGGKKIRYIDMTYTLYMTYTLHRYIYIYIDIYYSDLRGAVYSCSIADIIISKMLIDHNGSPGSEHSFDII